MGTASLEKLEEAGTSEGRQAGVAAELWHFLKHSKKWWLVPIAVVLLLFGLLMVLSGTAEAPFVYKLF